jgi:hypothetical protein
MSERFGILAGHIVEFSPQCSCGAAGSYSPHEQYCGVEPVMTLEQFARVVDTPVEYAFPGSWRHPLGSDVEFEVYVSTQDDTIKAHVSTDWHSPSSARAYAVALLQAADYSEREEAKA